MVVMDESNLTHQRTNKQNKMNILLENKKKLSATSPSSPLLTCVFLTLSTKCG